jgi:tRNA A37 threonylcarbamoyladenosine dehydratase
MQVEKVNYDINWKAFKRGWSFFIPCLDTVRAKREILEVTKRLGIKVLTKVVIVEGIRGLRIWRM